MTNLTPNDLSHLSGDEFNALCPQGEHAPGPTLLDPATQAVLDAFLANWADEPIVQNRHCLAAALRAAALYCKRDTLILLSLADELEALPDD